MIEQLGKKQPRIFDTLVGNIQAIIDAAPDLNLANDPNISALAAAARDLTQADADLLREDEATRKKVLARAREIGKAFKL
jgi:hypothetical protein